jgi:hypothetical protein
MVIRKMISNEKDDLPLGRESWVREAGWAPCPTAAHAWAGTPRTPRTRSASEINKINEHLLPVDHYSTVLSHIAINILKIRRRHGF